MAPAGSYKRLCEVDFFVGAHKDRIVYHNDDGSIDPPKMHHAIFKVELKDGNSYALDTAGAQYNHHRTITPWAEYEQQMIDNPVTEWPMKWGQQSQRFLALESPRELPEIWVPIRRYQLRALSVIASWLDKMQDASLKAMVEKKGAEWETGWATARALLKLMMTEFVAREKQRGSQ